MFRRMASAVALAAAMVGGVQASPVVYNFTFTPDAGVDHLVFNLNTQAWTGGFSTTVFSDLNGTGGTVFSDSNASEGTTFLRAAIPDLFDGSFSVALGDESSSVLGVPSFDFGTQQVTGTLFVPTSPPPPTGTVPEPASLALVMLAGLGLTATQRRRPRA